MNNHLAEQQYTKVLSYMEQKNEESFDRAAEVLRMHHYDLQTALAYGHHLHEREQQVRDRNEQQAIIIKKYFDFIANKKRQSPSFIALLFYGVKYIFSSIFRGIAYIMLPQSLLIRMFYSNFYRLYYRHIPLRIRKSSLKDLLLKTKNLQRKSVLIAISPPQTHLELVTLLSTPAIAESISMWFNFIGYTFDERNLTILGEIQRKPQIIICRMNAFEEVRVIKRFLLEQFDNVTPISLKQSYDSGVKLMEEDRAIVRLYKNYRMLMFGDIFIDFSSEDQEKVVKPPVESLEIAAQNEIYHALEREQQEKSRLLHEQEESRAKEREKLQQEHSLRKIRMESIPQQPKQGNFVRISFRCPNGSTLMRNFSTQEKIGLIYEWVEVNEEIEFEDEGRNFELMHSYPLRPLSTVKERRICEVFEESQEKIVIREL